MAARNAKLLDLDDLTEKQRTVNILCRTIFLRLGMVLDAILSFATFVEQSRRNGSKKTAERKQLPLLGLLISSSFVLKGSENMHFMQIPYLFD